MSNTFYPQLIIFYDGQCPLCVREMTQLKLKDEAQRIQFEDILATDFSERFPRVNINDANRILHGLENGEMLYGLDVTHRAWSLVGKGWMTAPLRWPLLRWFADKAYMFFARHRYTFSKIFTGKARCERCQL
ncbi:thiol-disulfide oxidoreductase DCC family protein [Aliidiomarina sp. B3213]|nr:DUF393 domain-containing protein [Aliidiomarina sp. B3213]RTE86928.1 DUF393 domain-containing protein [Aliidiomarina sp. B3213]TCZ93282.1 DUF393 domain-containing protein [Lysobacter sp. N42]